MAWLIGASFGGDDMAPNPQGTYEEFINGIPEFLPAVMEGITCILDQALEVSGEATGAEMVVASLTGSMAEDLQDIMTLCANERTNGALKLLRTPYEKFLYASHISKHPETANDFLQFDAIQSKALLTGIEDHWDYKISDKGKVKLDEQFKIAQGRFKRSKCPECGASGPRMWTKVTPEQMAKAAGVENIHVLAYRYATLMIHPSYRGISGQTSQAVKPPAVLGMVYKLTFETIRLQWLFFKKTVTVSGKVADVIRKLQAVSFPADVS
jgi:hypothetical protein